MRSVVTEPMVKGDVSARVAAVMDPPYLRFCRPCNAIHLYEMPFRLAALRAGLELQADTSPPMLLPRRGFERAAESREEHDVVRAYLRLLGPATPKHVADYLDAPVKDIKARWPQDAAEVSVEGELRWLLADDLVELAADQVKGSQLLGPFDLFLQAKDRTLLVADPAQRKALWPVLGRPGAVLVDGEITGMWRPKKSGKRIGISVELWGKQSKSAHDKVERNTEKLAAFRELDLSSVDFSE